MTQVVRGAGVLAGLAVWALAGPPSVQAPPPGGAAPLAPGWARLLASGTLTAVNQPPQTVTLAISGPVRLEEFEGGTVWRQKALGGTHIVYLLPATLLVDSGRRPIPAAAIRPGDTTALWAAVRPDAAILALTLQLTPPRPQTARSAPAWLTSAGAVGVVLERSGSMLNILTPAGTLRSVVMTGVTAISSGGQAALGGAVSPYDILRVDGPVNSDGSIAATRIDVEFSAASAAQVSGPIEWSVNELGGLVVGGTMIATSADTYIILRAALARAADLAPGRSVTVYGTPVRAGDTPIGLRARVVLARPY